jgi:hypothetical protein
MTYSQNYEQMSPNGETEYGLCRQVDFIWRLLRSVWSTVFIYKVVLISRWSYHGSNYNKVPYEWKVRIIIWPSSQILNISLTILTFYSCFKGKKIPIHPSHELYFKPNTNWWTLLLQTNKYSRFVLSVGLNIHSLRLCFFYLTFFEID